MIQNVYRYGKYDVELTRHSFFQGIELLALRSSSLSRLAFSHCITRPFAKSSPGNEEPLSSNETNKLKGEVEKQRVCFKVELTFFWQLMYTLCCYIHL